MLSSPLFLVHLSPERDPAPRVGERIRWPGDDRVWTWNGLEWVGERTEFDGGDAWDDEDERSV